MRSDSDAATGLTHQRVDAYLATELANQAPSFAVVARVARVAARLPGLTEEDLRRIQAIVVAAQESTTPVQNRAPVK
jgi:hypothetical protein